MIKTENKTVTTKREQPVIVEATCDQCIKQLKLENEKFMNSESDSTVIKNYVSLYTSHGDWGNDSHESGEHHEFCSVSCCLKWISENENDLKSGTRQFDIECEGTY